MDMNEIIKMAEKLKEQFEKAQEESNQLEVEAEAGGGLVKARVNGMHVLTYLFIDPTLVKKGDGGLIADMVKAAVNQAWLNLIDQQKRSIENLSKNLDVLPQLFDSLKPKP